VARKQGSAADYTVPGLWRRTLDELTREAQSPNPRALLDLEGEERVAALAELPRNSIDVRRLEQMKRGEPIEVDKPTRREFGEVVATIPWLADVGISRTHRVVGVLVSPDDSVIPVWKARDDSLDLEVNSQ
jgi:hypothetical protein